MSDKNGNGAKPDVDALREDIAQTRADLGETVQALAAKADVKARAKDELEQTKAKVKAQAAEATGKVKEAALTATDKVRNVAAQATDKAKNTTGKVRGSGPAQTSGPAQVPGSVGGAHEAQEPAGGPGRAEVVRARVQENPVLYAAVLAGVAGVLGIILIMRGRRA